MLKTLGAQIKEFKKDSLITPVFMILEVIMEMIIPLMMASIIDKGVEAGDMGHIYRMGGLMIAAAIAGLVFGIMGGKYGARASTGFARNLRKAMFENIQTFSFANIDKYSTSGLAELPTDSADSFQAAAGAELSGPGFLLILPATCASLSWPLQVAWETVALGRKMIVFGSS